MISQLQKGKCVPAQPLSHTWSPASAKVNRQEAEARFCSQPRGSTPQSLGERASGNLQNQAPNMVPFLIDILLVSLSSPSPSLQILLQKKPIMWPKAKTAFSKI